ncbi:hypothetical protein [Gluconobacter sp.]
MDQQILAELASKHDGHQTMIAQWKRQAIAGIAGIFSGKGGNSIDESG